MELVLTETTITKKLEGATSANKYVVEATYNNSSVVRVVGNVTDPNGVWVGSTHYENGNYSCNVSDPAVVAEFAGIVEQLKSEAV